jgi:hypothetical protein
MKNIPVLPLARRYRLRMLGLFLVVSWAVLTVVNRMAVETALPTLGEVVLSTFTLGLLIVGLSIPAVHGRRLRRVLCAALLAHLPTGFYAA